MVYIIVSGSAVGGFFCPLGRRLRRRRIVRVEAHENDRETICNANHDQACLSRRDSVLVENSLGSVRAKEEEDAVDVVQHEHERGRDEGKSHGPATDNEPRESGEERRQGKDEKLELNDKPLVLELVLGTLGVGNDVGRGLEDFIVNRRDCLNFGRAAAVEEGQGVGLPLEKRCAERVDSNAANDNGR